MMKEQVKRDSTAQPRLRWAINIIWILGWIVLFFMCINVFGNSVAFVGIPALIVFMILVWYLTDRRSRGEGAQ